MTVCCLVAVITACGGGGGGAANTGPVVEITSPQVNDRFHVGEAVSLQATATDAEDGDLTSAIVWKTNRRPGETLGTGGSISVSSLTVATHAITAEVRDSAGVRRFVNVSIQIVNDAPVLEAKVLDNRTELIIGETVTLQATASDTEDGILSSAVVWTSSIEGDLGTGTSLDIEFTVEGKQIISATVTDNNGASTVVLIDIEVLPEPDPANLYIKASNTEGAGSVCIVNAIDPADMSVGTGCDNFGFAMALSKDGNTLAVGAPFEDGDNNSAKDSGAVYIYRNGAGTWAFAEILRAPIVVSSDRFGSALSLNADGSVLAVTGFEAAYIYVYDGSSWSVGLPSDSFSTGFTTSVALNSAGDLLAVGSPEEDSVYLYTLAVDGAATAADILTASNQEAGDRFGVALALNAAGDTLVVGASQESSSTTVETDNSAVNAGAAYVFTRQVAVWSQTKYLKATNVQANSGFGSSVAINSAGTRVAIGAPRENISGDEPLLGDEGAVYVFADVASSWDLASRAVAANNQPGDNFGNKVALTADGLTLFAGARSEDSRAKGVNGSQTDDFTDPESGETAYNDADSGAVYAFDVSGLTGTQEAYYKAFNSAEGDKFGTSVAINEDGSIIAVGANLEDGSGKGVGAALDNVPGLQSGAVYLYR